MFMVEMLQQLGDNIIAISLWEWISTLAQILSVWYALRNNVLVFPTGLVGVLIAAYIYLFKIVPPLYAEGLLHLYYVGMSIYGWYAWLLRKADQSLVFPITWCNKKERLFGLLLVIGSWSALYLWLQYKTDSNTPVADAFVTSFSILGMWWMAKRKMENWIAYMISNAVAIPLNYFKELSLFSIMYLMFFFMAWSGFISWKKEMTLS
jgi:nicotinamide mononucleotide transporter